MECILSSEIDTVLLPAHRAIKITKQNIERVKRATIWLDHGLDAVFKEVSA